MTTLNKEPINTGQYLNELPTIARGAGILFLGALIGKMLAFFFNIFIARTLTPGELGLYYLGLTLISLLGTFALVGLGSGALRFVSLFYGQKDISRAKGTIVSCLSIVTPVGLLMAMLLFLYAESIAVHIFDKPCLENILKLFSVSIPFFAIGNILIISTLGFKLMQYKVACETSEIILRFVFVFLLVYILGFGLNGVVLGNVISSILIAFLAFYFLAKLIPILRGKERPILEFRKLLRFSFPQMFSEFFISLAIYTDTLMLGYFRTSEEVGVYNIVARLVISGIIISESFRIVFAPIIADLHNKGEMEQLNALFKVVTRWIFTISLPLFLLFILFPKPILNIFGKEFTVGSSCLITLSLGYLLTCAVGPVNHMVLMTGRSGLNFLNHLFALIINVLLNYLLIPKYGITGAALAMAISIASIDIIRLIETFYLMRIHPYNRSYSKPLFAGTISTVIIFFIYNMAPACPNTIGISVFLCCYLFIMYIFKLDKEESYVMKEIGRKLYPSFRKTRIG